MSQRELKILMCRFCQLGGLTLVQVCKVGEEKIVAQNFFHHRKERPQLGLKRHLKAFSESFDNTWEASKKGY